MGKQVITADEISRAAKSGKKTIDFKKEDCVVTPGAWDKIDELGIGFAAAAEDASQQTRCSRPESGILSPQNATGQTRTLADTSSDTASITDQVCAILKGKLPGADASQLSAIVKQVVAARFAGEQPQNIAESSSAVTAAGGVSLINGDALLDESGPAVPGKVQISDAIRCHEDTHLNATYMKWEATSFSRTVESPEISIVVEGELVLTTQGRTMKAKAGDILYMAKGAQVAYDAQAPVKLACISS